MCFIEQSGTNPVNKARGLVVAVAVFDELINQHVVESVMEEFSSS